MTREEQALAATEVFYLCRPEILELAGILWAAEAWATSLHAGYRQRKGKLSVARVLQIEAKEALTLLEELHGSTP